MTGEPRAGEEIVRLPSSIGVGRCVRCKRPCMAGWSHMPEDCGFCDDCAFLLAGPEFVRETMGLVGLSLELEEARTVAVRRTRIERRRNRA